MKSILGLIVFLGIALLFFISPGHGQSRLFLEIWNLGHFLLFFSVSFLWLYLFAHKQHKSFSIPLFITLCLSVAVFTELLQLLIPNRSFSIIDIGKDMAGCIYALLLYLVIQKKLSKILFSFTTIILFSVLLRDTLSLLVEEYKAQRDFPVLANFEQSSDLNKWSGSNVSIASSIQMSGAYSLKVDINSEQKYSGTNIQYFPSDWLGYDSLQFDIFVKNKTSLTMRVHDIHHINNNNYSDRFNKNIKLEKGWNRVNVPLNEIKSAPNNREMDMEKIHNLGFFSIKPHLIEQFYIDNVQLAL